MAQSTLRVVVVAAEPAQRRLLAETARGSGGHVVVASASRPTRRASAHVAILAGGGERDIAEMRLLAPDLPLIVALPGASPAAAARLLRAGVAGIVTWAALEQTLGATIRAVTCGQVCVPRAHAAQVAPPQLSVREKQILGMVVLGFANGEIARRLVIAESTVKSHLHSAFRKLGVRSRVEATALILSPSSGLGTGILTIPTSTPAAQRSPV